MKIVADSTHLIHLAKIGKINLLKNLFDKIIIENEVYKEIVEKGEKHNEVPLIKRLIEQEFISVKKTNQEISILDLHEGEKMSISLCKKLKIEDILIDDEDGFNASRMLNLMPIRTTSILIILLDKRIIDFKEYKSALKDLSQSGYFLDALTYDRLLNIGLSLPRKNK